MSRERLQGIAESMSREQLHRGPDDSGVWVDEATGLALGFRRLAILDLSVEGSQPMLSRSRRFSIVFNGEIYNYHELRKALETGGAPESWRGHSDTEVLLACIEKWGIAGALRQANGMFGMAVWDAQTRSLHLARDRAGEKPLYYGWCGGSFLFGSELGSLRAHPSWRGELDRNVLPLYLRHGYVPGPHSIYRGILKVPPATIVTLHWGDGRAGRAPQSEQYWSALGVIQDGIAARKPVADEEAVEELDRTLRAAVKIRTFADVPVGAFLSGGIDSSVIVALMQAQSERPVRTFSIGFADSKYDEASQAKLVAAHLGTDHTEAYLTETEATELIPRLPAIYSEPFADSSQIPTALVSAIARKDVTVALSGDGGDELFGGYNRYIWGRRLLQASTVPAGVRSLLARAVMSVPPQRWNATYDMLSSILPGRARASHPGDSIHKLAKVMDSRDVVDLYRRLTSYWADGSALVRDAAPDVLPDPIPPLSQPADAMDYMMYMDFMTYLPDDILVKVDRASMASSLEARVPFLDPQVIAHAWSLPMRLKYRDGKGKWIIRQVLERYVPASLTDRPKKGFAVPIDAWLRGPLKKWASALLEPARITREGYFHAAPITQYWNEHLSGRRNRQHELWVVLMFQAWLEAERA